MNTLSKTIGSAVEALDKVPRLVPTMVVKQTWQRGPRVKQNPDGKMHMVRSTYVHSTSLWLIVITYKPHKHWRVRVWLRPNMDEPALDDAGFYTKTGAEWKAYGYLENVFNVLRGHKDKEL